MKLLNFLWKYLRWIFPPFLIWKLIVLTYLLITWPIRKLFGKKGRRFKDKLMGEQWALAYCSNETSLRGVGMRGFQKVWSEYQDSRSYISRATIIQVGKEAGLTLEEMMYVMTSAHYQDHWVIEGWSDLLLEFGVTDHRTHRSKNISAFMAMIVEGDWHKV